MLWGLCSREYEALKHQWEQGQRRQTQLLSVLRADLHNTSSRDFKKVFTYEDFMPEAVDHTLEYRIAQLVEKGYTPSQAAAMATSKKSKEHNLYLIDKKLDAASRQAKKPKLGRKKLG